MKARRGAATIGWISLAAAAAAAFVWLGNWQLSRADEKREIHTSFRQRGDAARINLNDALFSDRTAAEMAGYPVRVVGQYANENVLLDNQVNAGRAGYMVYTPLKVRSAGYWILVNRGWVPIPPDRGSAPPILTVSELVTATGLASDVVSSGMVLRGADEVERLDAKNIRLQRIDLTSLAEWLEIPLAPFTVLLDPGVDTDFVRHWRIPGSGQERHLGYAFQWFAMAATVIILCAALLWRARRE